MVRYYQFAGVEIGFVMSEDEIYQNERNLKPFRVEQANAPHMFTFEWCDQMPEPTGKPIEKKDDFCVYQSGEMLQRYFRVNKGDWETALMCVEGSGKDHRVHARRDRFRGYIPAHIALNAISAEHLIAQKGGFIFHCAYIDHSGKAILFTAPSGTGKSTQAELWKNLRGSEIINGDRAAVRVADGILLAEGIPFAGSSGVCKNRTLPIAAIVYLAQAPETSISKLNGISAFRHIWEGCSVNQWNRDDVSVAADTAMAVVNRVPVYYMPCTPDETAVSALEQMLKEQIGL